MLVFCLVITEFFIFLTCNDSHFHFLSYNKSFISLFVHSILYTINPSSLLSSQFLYPLPHTTHHIQSIPPISAFFSLFSIAPYPLLLLCIPHTVYNQSLRPYSSCISSPHTVYHQPLPLHSSHISAYSLTLSYPTTTQNRSFSPYALYLHIF